jgi:hypothetical protein
MSGITFMQRFSIPVSKRRNVMITYRRWFGFVAATVAAVVLLAASVGDASVAARAGDDSDGGDATCWGGSVVSGSYSNLKIAGDCNLDAGSVRVKQNLTVLSGGTLLASFGGSNITVGGDLDVKMNGILVLGCEPVNYICLNDPDHVTGTYSTKDRVGGDLKAENALSVVVHLTVIGHDVSLNGGGGGASCSSFLPALGSPPYGDLEDNIIGGDLKIRGWQSCWLGFFRDAIAQNVDFKDNVTADPDGNEMGTNSIGGNLSCTGNLPVPQVGDSGGSLNNVFGSANGQCANPKLVR